MKLKTIKSRITFHALRQRGVPARTDLFRVVFLEQTGFEVAFAMPKTLGNAVKRNKLKRQMKEAIKAIDPPPQAGAYLFKPYQPAMTSSYAEISADLGKLLKKVQLSPNISRK